MCMDEYMHTISLYNVNVHACWQRSTCSWYSKHAEGAGSTVCRCIQVRTCLVCQGMFSYWLAIFWSNPSQEDHFSTSKANPPCSTSLQVRLLERWTGLSEQWKRGGCEFIFALAQQLSVELLHTASKRITLKVSWIHPSGGSLDWTVLGCTSIGSKYKRKRRVASKWSILRMTPCCLTISG